MRLRFRPLVTIAPKVSPDPVQAAELARRRAEITFRPSYGFIVDEVKKAGPRFAAVVDTTKAPAPDCCNWRRFGYHAHDCSQEHLRGELVHAPAQDPTAQQIVSEALVAGTPSDTAAPAVDWSKYDAPAWERRGRPDPMRSTINLLLPVFLRRQAD